MNDTDPTRQGDSLPSGIAEYIRQCQQIIDQLQAEGVKDPDPDTQARLDRMFSDPTQPHQKRNVEQARKPAKFDRTVYVMHHPDKDPLDAPVTRRYPTAEDAWTKATRTKNKRTVSKITIERPE